MKACIGAIVQARLGSTRLPGKVLCDIAGKPLVWHIINRISSAKLVGKTILATTTNPVDDELERWAIESGVRCFRGDELNVLNRYYECAKIHKLDVIVRITADDPLKDAEIIDETIKYFTEHDLDFASNNNPPSYPEGLDVEVFTMKALSLANMSSTTSFEKEHVTQFFYNRPNLFKLGNLKYFKDVSNLRWTVDTMKDLEMVRVIYSHLYDGNNLFSFQDILALLKKNPAISNINVNETRSTMYKKR